MAVLQDININVHGQPSEKRLQTFLRLSQNENGRLISFRVLGPPLPSNCTATFSGTKPDGNVYSKAGTVTGNFVTIEEDIQMTAVAGVWDAKLDIINGTHNIMTALIRVVVDADVVDPDAIASDSQLQGLVAEAKYYAEHARTDAYGSPLTAALKAEMTDKTRVYVYTGSETGMTAGNWYYWNGSAWTSGGVYNAVAVQTDTTLRVAGKAADGKATGDAIDALKEDLNSVRDVLSLGDDGTIAYTKENNGKYIRFSTGELTTSTPYCTTNYVNISGLGQITYSRIKTTSDSTTVGMAFYDANKTYISGIRAKYQQEEAGYEEYTADVPANSVYARFTLFIDETTYGNFAVSGKSVLKSAFDELAETVAPLVGVDGRVGAIEDIVTLKGNFDIPFTILEAGRSIKYSTGETMANSNNSATDYINITVFGSLTYRRIKQTDSGTAGMAFYDANKVYISGNRAYTNASEAGYMDELAVITVPPNAVYARFTTKKDTETYGEFSLTGSSKLHDLLPKESIYRKDVIFSSMSPEWYKGQGDAYNLFTSNATYSDMITAWDELADNSKGYITKETIGLSSNNQTMYCYKLIPLRYRNNTGNTLVNNPPTFLIVASQHGFEKSAAYGTYYFARDLVYNFDKNPVLNSIRTKCAVYVIPVANPYGFDNKLRKNANGVDLNRNWGPSDDDDPTSAYYGGAEPFDQPETQAIKSVIDGYPNLFFMTDYHTNGQYKADSWANVNWISYPHLATINDEYYNRLYIAGQFHISDLSENLPIEYDLNTNGSSIGSATQGAAGAPRPTIGYYCRTQNIMGFTFEGNNGLPSEESAYSAMEQKVNSELIGNWIKNIYLAFQNA